MLLCSLFRNVYSVLYHIPQLSDCLLKEESTSLIGFNKKSSYSSPHMNIHSAINKMDSLSSCSQFTAESTTTNEFDLASDDSSSSESMGEDEQRKMIEKVKNSDEVHDVEENPSPQDTCRRSLSI